MGNFQIDDARNNHSRVYLIINREISIGWYALRTEKEGWEKFQISWLNSDNLSLLVRWLTG